MVKLVLVVRETNMLCVFDKATVYAYNIYKLKQVVVCQSLRSELFTEYISKLLLIHLKSVFVIV